MQRAAAHAHDGVINVEHLHLPATSRDAATDDVLNIAASDRPICEIEHDYTQSLLEQYSGNRKRVAAVLGISERTLYRRLKSYQRDPKRGATN
jgi:two-component system response regulator AtoC